MKATVVSGKLTAPSPRGITGPMPPGGLAYARAVAETIANVSAGLREVVAEVASDLFAEAAGRMPVRGEIGKMNSTLPAPQAFRTPLSFGIAAQVIAPVPADLVPLSMVCERTGMTRGHLYDLKGRGEISFVKVGKYAFLPRSEYDALIRGKVR